MRCLSCQYDLKNLSSGGEPRCPECGREFDPKNRRTFDDFPQELPGDIPGWVWLVLVVIMSAVVGLVFLYMLAKNPMAIPP